MKLRIRGNNIRMRVTRGELTQMAESGRVEDAVNFVPGRSLEYCLERSATASRPEALFDGSRITIRLPEATVIEWIKTEQVSIRGTQPFDNDESLSILVEKDFACLVEREGEDDSDMFAHPEADSGQGC